MPFVISCAFDADGLTAFHALLAGIMDPAYFVGNLFMKFSASYCLRTARFVLPSVTHGRLLDALLFSFKNSGQQPRLVPSWLYQEHL